MTRQELVNITAKIERLTKDHEKLVAENTKLMYFINQQQAEKKDFKFGNF